MYMPCRIQIRSQVAIYTDGVFHCGLSSIGIFLRVVANLNAPAFIVDTCFLRHFFQLPNSSYIRISGTVSDIGDAAL